MCFKAHDCGREAVEFIGTGRGKRCISRKIVKN
jgi:hypothetical protein